MRSQSMRGRMELSGLFVPTAAKWLSDLRAELIAFPQSAHESLLAAALGGLALDRKTNGDGRSVHRNIRDADGRDRAPHRTVALPRTLQRKLYRKAISGPNGRLFTAACRTSHAGAGGGCGRSSAIKFPGTFAVGCRKAT